MSEELDESVFETDEYKRLKGLYDKMYESVLSDGCMKSEVDALLAFDFGNDVLEALMQKIDMLIDIKNDELFPRIN